ncbi:MAG: hypothetical protein PHN69_02915 [Candidatus Pacebacteria bacterium]|nr:hypothetical protein [Candidatus Paceibacterota bacterium]
MKPITLYFAGSESGIEGGLQNSKELGFGIQHRLTSYLYPKEFYQWLRYSEGEPGSVILDSGAFSAWNNNQSINIDEYIAYCKKAIKVGSESGKEIHVVNLDVIPGKVGESAKLSKLDNGENEIIINKAAEEGFANLIRMKEEGITPIHVFHQGENWEYLHRMVEQTDYIGISPANDLSVRSRVFWMLSVFEYMYEKKIEVKTHGFAVWMLPVLKHLPFTSCDAATCVLLAAHGGFYYPIGGFKNPRYAEAPFTYHPGSRKSTEGIGNFTPEIVKMFNADGYSFDSLQDWKTRTEINIRYVKGLETWVNQYRPTFEFRPRIKLF